MEHVIVLRASRLKSMENVIVLPGSIQLATAANEKTVDIHVFIAITGSISLISMCLLLSLVDIPDIHVFITITGRYL
jgi:hypothetical protein